MIVLGAGGIVNDAHLPAYRKAGILVAGIYDVVAEKARATAEKFGIPRVFETLGEAVASDPARTIFDVAVPASALGAVIEALPNGAAVLLQKPFGVDLDQARQLLAQCQRKRLRAAVNFQLRFAPCIAAARALIEQGAIGAVHDFETRVTVYTPWHLWPFLQGLPRVEIVYHSIHYIDLVRSFFGEPRGVYAKTTRHPAYPNLAATRTQMILDYGDEARASISTNHGHNFGRKYQESFVKWEGTTGALRARLGVLLDYPAGESDALEICRLDAAGRAGAWESVPLQGNWFPDGFIGVMASVQRFAAGAAETMPTNVEDAFHTMAVVEAAYSSSQYGASPIPQK
ncbi:MAG TPA: Gfo/Idh/MocA family oxidoreductase [Opitutaceae bacterium]|nr:Gfo/Idh/MocA family oxidoreductase [Opitutaceae bacterium]